ncbi:hypothetical protein RB599_011124 [Gaeumannomyces hyphopodioides]
MQAHAHILSSPLTLDLAFAPKKHPPTPAAFLIRLKVTCIYEARYKCPGDGDGPWGNNAKFKIDMLADLLYMAPRHMYEDGQPRNSWLRHQKDKMERSSFPKRLQRPKGALNWVRLRVAEKTGWTHEEFLPQVADLCEVHKKGLNPWLIHDVFKLVHDESTLRTTRIRGHKSDLCTPEVLEFLARIAGINSLWLDASKFNHIFGRHTPIPERFCFRKFGNAVTNSRVGNNNTDESASTSSDRSSEKEDQPRRPSCEACVLACVGGHPELLTALRASLLGRTKSKDKSKAPILILLIDSWVEYGKAAHQKATIEAESNELSHALRAIRVAEGKVQKEIRNRRARRAEEGGRNRDEKRLSRHSRQHHHGSGDGSADRHRERRDRPASHHSARPATVDPTRLGANLAPPVARAAPPRARSHVIDATRRADPMPAMQSLRREGSSISNFEDLQARTAAQHRAMVESGEWDRRGEFPAFESSESVDGHGLPSSRFSELGFSDDHYTEIGVQMKQQRQRAGGSTPAPMARPRAASSVYSQDSTVRGGPPSVRASSSSRPSDGASSASTVRAGGRRAAPVAEERDPETVGGRRERAVTAWYNLMSQAGSRRDVNEDGVSALDETEDFPGYSEMLVDDVAPSECDDDDNDNHDGSGQGGGGGFRGARSAWSGEKGGQPRTNDDAATWVSVSVHSEASGRGCSRQDSPATTTAAAAASSNQNHRPHSMYMNPTEPRPASCSGSSRTAPPGHTAASSYSLLDYYLGSTPESAAAGTPPVFKDPFAGGGGSGRARRPPPSTAVAPSDVGGRRPREGG